MNKMNTGMLDVLCCPKCHGKLSMKGESKIVCEKSDHVFSLEDGMPVFVKKEEINPKDAKWVFEYDETAEKYDELIVEYNAWLEVDDLMQEFTNAFEEAPLKEGQHILDVSVGTGNVNFGIQKAYPNMKFKFAGVDLSVGFLKVAQRKFKESGIESLLVHSQVFELPFPDETFDVITHSGGINTYSDIPGTLKEWVRVLKPGGMLWIVDEGVDPAERQTTRGKRIMKDNTLFAAHPPLEHLPKEVKDIRLRWVARGTFYVLTCWKRSKKELAEI